MKNELLPSFLSFTASVCIYLCCLLAAPFVAIYFAFLVAYNVAPRVEENIWKYFRNNSRKRMRAI